jgi:hypothetical protein
VPKASCDGGALLQRQFGDTRVTQVADCDVTCDDDRERHAHPAVPCGPGAGQIGAPAHVKGWGDDRVCDRGAHRPPVRVGTRGQCSRISRSLLVRIPKKSFALTSRPEMARLPAAHTCSRAVQRHSEPHLVDFADGQMDRIVSDVPSIQPSADRLLGGFGPSCRQGGPRSK